MIAPNGGLMNQSEYYKSSLERALDLLDTLCTWEYYELEHLNALDEARALLKEWGRTRPEIKRGD